MILIISFLSNRLAEFLCKKGIVESEEKEIYVYGYEMVITTLLGAIIVFGTALILNRFLESLIFFAVFVITRQHCGGFHANTRTVCTVSFVICFAFVLLFSKLLEPIYNLMLNFLIEMPYLVTIIGFAPIINENKPLDYDGKQANKKKSIVLSFVWITISSVITTFSPIIAATVALTLLIIAVLMVIEILKRKE